MAFIVEEEIERYSLAHTSREPELLYRLVKRTQQEMEYAQMLTGRIEGRLLKHLVQISRAGFVLEVGTFTGYSALSMAEGLPADGRLVTCEVDPNAAAIAQEFFAESPHGKKIELKLAPALGTIAALDQEIDFAFVDADKINYDNYFEAILPKLRPGGILVFDNMLWSGKVLDPQDADTKALAALNEKLASDERVENVLLTVRDGIQLVRKC